MKIIFFTKIIKLHVNTYCFQIPKYPRHSYIKQLFIGELILKRWSNVWSNLAPLSLSLKETTHNVRDTMTWWPINCWHIFIKKIDYLIHILVHLNYLNKAFFLNNNNNWSLYISNFNFKILAFAAYERWSNWADF